MLRTTPELKRIAARIRGLSMGSLEGKTEQDKSCVEEDSLQEVRSKLHKALFLPGKPRGKPVRVWTMCSGPRSGYGPQLALQSGFCFEVACVVGFTCVGGSCR